MRNPTTPHRIDPTTQRALEVDFPLHAVSAASLREKNIRHGHIGTLHLWWARRPLAASRATAFAALLPDEPGTRRVRSRTIERLAEWENLNDEELWSEARRTIREAYGGAPPRILDPFSGGGSIPLEAARLGCETHAVDYNPVAVLLLKAALELPHGNGGEGLEQAFRHWSRWMHHEIHEELAPYYATNLPETTAVLAYLWARTVPCQNPACRVEIPLMRQTWLARKRHRKIALRLEEGTAEHGITSSIVTGDQLRFDPAIGTVARATVRCPRCGATIDARTTRRLFREGVTGQRLMTIVCRSTRGKKEYRTPAATDMHVYEHAAAALEEKREALRQAWGCDPLPDEPLPPQETLGFRVQRYGITDWSELFNARQNLALLTLSEKVRAAYSKLKERDGEAMARSVAVYLAFVASKLADWNSVLSVWRPDQERNEHVFNRQALPMVWDYAERNPLQGDLIAGRTVATALAHLRRAVKGTPVRPRVTHASATALPYPAEHFDAVFTDPPYYDNVPYSDLSDFFYVRLKRSVGSIFPAIFATPLTPKAQEIVQDPSKHGGSKAAKAFFQQSLEAAFGEIARVLKRDGVAVIVFAHKTTHAWETVVRALLAAGLYPTASWPIATEMRARLRAQSSAALASSVYLVCRKRTAEATGEYPRVRAEITAVVRERLEGFWNAGIRGADFFMSAVGPAVSAFGRYRRVEKLSGEPVGVAELIEYVRHVVAEFALNRIIATASAQDLDRETRFYLLWRWTYGHTSAPFDDARKLAQCVGVELESLSARAGSFVRKHREQVRVLGPTERENQAGLLDRSRRGTMIDALHGAAILWGRNDGPGLEKHLRETFGLSDVFWHVAQAVAEALGEDDGEKQLLQGLLYSHGR